MIKKTHFLLNVAFKYVANLTKKKNTQNQLFLQNINSQKNVNIFLINLLVSSSKTTSTVTLSTIITSTNNHILNSAVKMLNVLIHISKIRKREHVFLFL